MPLACKSTWSPDSTVHTLVLQNTLDRVNVALTLALGVDQNTIQIGHHEHIELLGQCSVHEGLESRRSV